MSYKINSVLAAVVMAFALLGCEAEEENLSYEFSYNGCNTGKHEFDSKDAFCVGLKDYRANNNGCAYDLRKQAYEEKGCAGEFEEVNR